jgi:hypothetical protein
VQHGNARGCLGRITSDELVDDLSFSSERVSAMVNVAVTKARSATVRLDGVDSMTMRARPEIWGKSRGGPLRGSDARLRRIVCQGRLEVREHLASRAFARQGNYFP